MWRALCVCVPFTQVLTTYSTLENDFRRTMMPAKVACRWARARGVCVCGGGHL
jgi:hypothetical protein